MGKELPEISQRLTRIEQAAREAKKTFPTLVVPKGKEAVNQWEEELKDERKGKEWDDTVLEADWVTYSGATHPRETLYQKMVETT